MKYLLFLFLSLQSAFISAQVANDTIQWEECPAGRFQTCNVAAFRHILEQHPEIQLLDVRTRKEFRQGAVPGAVCLDVKKKNFRRKALRKLDKSRPVAVYCKGGVRSRRAAALLTREGFSVYNLDKGYDSWKMQPCD